MTGKIENTKSGNPTILWRQNLSGNCHKVCPDGHHLCQTWFRSVEGFSAGRSPEKNSHHTEFPSPIQHCRALSHFSVIRSLLKSFELGIVSAKQHPEGKWFPVTYGLEAAGSQRKTMRTSVLLSIYLLHDDQSFDIRQIRISPIRLRSLLGLCHRFRMHSLVTCTLVACCITCKVYRLSDWNALLRNIVSMFCYLWATIVRNKII